MSGFESREAASIICPIPRSVAAAHTFISGEDVRLGTLLCNHAHPLFSGMSSFLNEIPSEMWFQTLIWSTP